MPTTQQRPHSGLAGRRFGSFAGRAEAPASSHPVGKIIQPGAYGVTSGRRYGSFAGRAAVSGPDFDLAAPAIVPLSGALGITGSFSFVTPPPPPGSATITIRLLDAAVSGAPLPDLTGIQWAWWDSAADEAQTWGVTPTASGTTEVSDASGAIDLVAASSTKTSGQTAFIKLYKHGYPPRAFSGLLTVD
jgi:hypothetical protein